MSSSHLDQTSAEFIKWLSTFSTTPLYELPISDERYFLTRVQDAYPQQRQNVTIKRYTLREGPTDNIPITIVRPANTYELLPITVHVHGGGWILGDEYIFSHFIQVLAVKSNSAVVFIEYDKSPEAQWPIALEQIYATLVHLSQYGQDYNLDSSRISIIGDSVGGNMTTVNCLLAAHRPENVRIIQQILIISVSQNHSASYYCTLFALLFTVFGLIEHLTRWLPT